MVERCGRGQTEVTQSCRITPCNKGKKKKKKKLKKSIWFYIIIADLFVVVFFFLRLYASHIWLFTFSPSLSMTIQLNYFGTWLGGAAAFSQPPNEKLIGSSPLCSCATHIRSCDPHPSGCLIREQIRFKLGLAGVGYTVLAVMEPPLQKSTLMRTKGTAQTDTDIIIHTHTHTLVHTQTQRRIHSSQVLGLLLTMGHIFVAD